MDVKNLAELVVESTHNWGGTLISENAKTVANTILQQMGGTNRLGLMINAKNFLYGTNKERNHDFVTFQFARGKGGINAIQIFYNRGSDLYDIQFLKVSGTKGRQVVKELEGIFADSLMDVFEHNTGLYLTISPRR